MGGIEELPDESGACPKCGKVATTKCTGCKQVYYCNRNCQKADWKLHKPICKALPYKLGSSPELGNFMVANKDLKQGELILHEAPLVIGPSQMTIPVCLLCYNPVDGSFKCPKSGWPLCGPDCAKKVAGSPEVLVPAQTGATFEIDEYFQPCYLYECITPLRALMLQKTAPSKWKTLMKMESHIGERRGTPAWDKTQATVVEVMKKTLGIMVFEAICPEIDFSDETIQKIQGILVTNMKEIRLAASDAVGVYALAAMMEHSCMPNIKMTFDKQFNITLRAARDISEGEHLSTMYTHALWGTIARRDHLAMTKNFWCNCSRCCDATEFGSNISTIFDSGKPMLPEDPLDSSSDWVCKETGMRRNAMEVKAQLSEIGQELEMMMNKGTIDDAEQFLEQHSKLLHPNHYHMTTCKHNLMQMYGRTEGYLIQDMDEEQLARKKELCLEHLEVLRALDRDMIRLNIYSASAHFELHLPLLQVAKRAWETGKMATEEFREALKEPFKHLQQAERLLEDETNENLPEGQLRTQVRETSTQLEGFMKTVGCQL